MNAIIKATGVSTDASITSSVEHAVIAAKNCIAHAGIDMQEIDYLLNVGIYRDFNMVEPSVAAFIQKDIGINPDFLRFPVPSTAFSTDLMNGAAGAINAFHVSDALFKAGRKGYVLVVSSDSHPSKKLNPDFPITSCGAAVLLAPGNGQQGFQHFTFKDTTDGYLGESSYINFEKMGLDARHQIIIERDPAFHDRLLSFAASTAKEFMEQHHIDPNKIVLIAPSPHATFSTQLAHLLGVPAESTINLWDAHRDTHTSAYGIGFNTLSQLKPSPDKEHVLFVGAGAGINASCALYKL